MRMVRHRLHGSRFAHASAGVRRRGALLAVACVTHVPGTALAHGFGQRYELPLPLSLYLYGAAAVVALSFLMFGLFFRPAREERRIGPRLELIATPLGRALSHPGIQLALKLGTFALFLVTVVGGVIGDQSPYRNIAPTLVWIVWWVGLVYVAAFAGDLWALVNPWRTAFDGAQWLYRRLGGRGELTFGLTYSPLLGVWPACVLLLAVSWTELVYPNAASPVHIAALALGYSALTWTGMLLFGRDTWLANAEVFSLVFGTFARFAPTEVRAGRLLLRPFGAGLLEDRPVSTSMVAFILLLLASVLYDGLIGTGEWAAFEGSIRDRWPGLSGIGIGSVGLFAFWLVFVSAYLGICAVMSWMASCEPRPLEVARSFALTLIPIAIGYHVAHYLVFLLVQGQYVIPLLSDPFGRGWNLLGTAGYRVDIAFVGARFAWYTALAAIVTGHVLAVYLGHLRAMAMFAPTGVVLGTQGVLTALMVVYTFIGLSISAEPITESRVAAVATERVAIPPEAVLPEAQSGHLQAVGPGKVARSKLTYKVLGSAFHDGTKTSPADLLYAYAFAYRWGVPGPGERTRYDPFIDTATAPMRRQLLGVRVAGTDVASKSFRVGDVNFVREVFTVEVYLAIAPADPEWSAVVAPPWSTLPWHVLMLMEETVERGWAAFSAQEAKRRGVPWLDLVRSKELGANFAALALEFERSAKMPEALLQRVSAEEARRRWAALTAFHTASGHLLVTNGPYRLKGWSQDGVTLEAFRDPTYPLGVGSYDAYAIPRRGFVTKVQRDGSLVTVSGDIEVVEKFQRSYRLVRAPLTSVAADVARRSSPQCRYLVIAADGEVALAGIAALGPEARFQIDLGNRLLPGRYTLAVVMAVNGNVINAEIHRIEFLVPFQR
jgi:hypothetical protein